MLEVEVSQAFQGPVVEMLGQRKGTDARHAAA